MKRIFNWTNIRLLLMFAFVMGLAAFASARNAQRKLTGTRVDFTHDSDPFIKQEAVNKLLIENRGSAKSITKDKVDLNRLEKSINGNPMIEKSEVSVGIDGTLKAVVKQRTPIARVFDANGSFYIDYQGEEMPLSDEFTARVPIVSGEINTIDRSKLASVLRFVHDDDFLKKNIIGVQVLPSGGLKMRNRDFDYTIEFGRTINIERKFANYKAFFQKAVTDSSLYHYSNINLKFTQQVVCTK